MNFLQSFQKRQYLTIHHPQSNVISGFGRSSRRSCAGKLRESQKRCCLSWTPLHPIASIQIVIELIGKCSGENLSGLEVHPRDKQHIDDGCGMLLQCLQIFVHSCKYCRWNVVVSDSHQPFLGFFEGNEKRLRWFGGSTSEGELAFVSDRLWWFCLTFCFLWQDSDSRLLFGLSLILVADW